MITKLFTLIAIVFASFSSSAFAESNPDNNSTDSAAVTAEASNIQDSRDGLIISWMTFHQDMVAHLQTTCPDQLNLVPSIKVDVTIGANGNVEKYSVALPAEISEKKSAVLMTAVATFMNGSTIINPTGRSIRLAGDVAIERIAAN